MCRVGCTWCGRGVVCVHWLHLVRRFCVFEPGCVAWGVVGAVVGWVFWHGLRLVRRFCVFEPGCVASGVLGAVVGVVFVHWLHLVRRFCVFEPGCVASGVLGDPHVVGFVWSGPRFWALSWLCLCSWTRSWQAKRVSDCLCVGAWFISSWRIGWGMPQLVG